MCFNPEPVGNIQKADRDWSDVTWAVDVAQAAGIRASNDTIRPTVPLVVNAPTANSTADSTRPTVSGTGVPGQDIRIFGRQSGSAFADPVTVGEDGRWTALFNRDLPSSDGRTVGFWVRSYDRADAPDNSPIDQRELFVRPHLATAKVTTPANGSTAYGQLEYLAGIGEPGATVSIVGAVGGTLLGTPTVDEDGNWAVVLNRAVTPQDAPYVLNINQRLNGMNASHTRFRVTVMPSSLALPRPVTITWQGDTPTFTGTTISNADVIVKGATHGTLLGEGNADADGNFSIPMSRDLPAQADAYLIRVVAASAITADLEVGYISLYRSILRTPAEGATLDKDHDKPTFTGTAPAGASVIIQGVTGGTILAKTTAAPDGIFSVQSEIALAAQEAPYRIRAIVTLNSTTSISPERSFIRKD